MSVQVSIDEDDLFLERSPPNIKERLNQMVTIAQAQDMDSEESFRKMTNFYAQAKDWEKRIEFARKQANEPDQERINARNDKAKEILTPLKALQSISKSKCAQYQERLEQLKEQEMKRIEDTVDLLGLEETPYLAPIEKCQRGDGAIAYTKIVKKFKVTNLSLVPMKYLQINESAVELDIKMGVMEMPGIEIWEEKVTQLRTR